MRLTLFAITFAVILASTWMAFTLGQVAGGETEAAITFEKNIVYVHVPSAICTAACFVVVLVAGIGYLRTGNDQWDRLGAASAEVALIFATVLNATGSIFARPFWGTWWTPSPRLISSAILWFLCIAYLILRASIQNPRHRARICAVFGIIAFLDVPLVFMSARLMPDHHIGNVEFESGVQSASFGLSILGIIMLAGLLIWLKTDVLKTKVRLESDLA